MPGHFISEKGRKDDISFHGEILDNSKADKACRVKSYNSALKMGIDPETAKEIFLEEGDLA